MAPDAQTRLDAGARSRRPAIARIEARSSWARHSSVAIAVAAAVVFAVVAIVVTSSSGRLAPLARGLAPGAETRIGCHPSDPARHDENHDSCCGACALAAAPIRPEAPPTPAGALFPVSTKIAFRLVHGRRLDGGPADVRSRAPPLAA